MKCSVTCIREFFKVWWRGTFDLITILLLLVLFIGLYVAANNGSVVKRGFYCDDVSIRFPFRESTVPSWALIVSVLSIPLVAIIGGNMYERFVSHKARPGKPFHMCGKDSQSCIVPYWIARAIYEFRWFLCGLLVTLVVTDFGKLVVGRLRPNFLDVCNPDFSQFNCTDQFGNPRYVTDYDCRGKPHDVDGSRVSWPSGHSSTSSYGFIFLTLYVSSVRSFYSRSAFRFFLMLVSFLLTMLVGLSRISDNKHHPTDVLSGWFIGSAVAFVTVYYNLKYFGDLKPRNRDQEDKDNTPGVYEIMEGNRSAGNEANN